MSSNENLYSLDFLPFKKDVKSIFRIMFSQTLFPFYGLAFSLLIILLIILK